VSGEVPRVGTGIGERLVLLIQSLCGPEGSLGGEPVPVVRLPLQGGEVVEHRRFLALLFLLEARDRPRPALAGAHDRDRLLLGGDPRALGVTGATRGGLEVPDVGALAARLPIERG